MSDQAGRAVSSRVEVPVDPGTAFVVFTEELDLWWVRGPINFHAAGRAREMRCEPGVGGRLLEIYDEDGADALELARVTTWEPGERLAWRSSIDDVETEVRFAPLGTGSIVEVTARTGVGGRDGGGSAWVRVVPDWYGAWCRRRHAVPHVRRDIARLGLAVSYVKPLAAARWLADNFGFESPGPLPDGDDAPAGDDGDHTWIELRVGDSSLMLFGATSPHAPDHLTVPWVYVDDIEAHHRRSVGAGAEIVRPLDSPWGLPMYTAADLEGHHWTFAQARPTMP
jgi:uncharacterized glyoxalase superfamily protein PhnB